MQYHTGSIWNQTENIMVEIFYKQHLLLAVIQSGIRLSVCLPVTQLSPAQHQVTFAPFKFQVRKYIKCYQQFQSTHNNDLSQKNPRNPLNWSHKKIKGSPGVTAQRTTYRLFVAALVLRERGGGLGVWRPHWADPTSPHCRHSSRLTGPYTPHSLLCGISGIWCKRCF